ncbi:universal stress protein UspA [Halobacteriales archaeon QH_10_67_13]|nr:MAG: universal stress protein UspA [Halobacteriales archaeon QH_10_67_13]
MSTDGTRVLVPVDDSDHAQRAADLAAELFPGGTLVLLHVVNPTEVGFGAEAAIPTFPEGWYEETVEHAERIFETIGATVDANTDTEVEVGQPTRTIVEYADGADIDHIVMGSHGRKGVSRVLLGSVAESVMRRASVPVTVVR